MIALDKETLIALRDVPKRLPRRPSGKRLHISALYRWIERGVCCVVLEAVRIGGTTYTSAEALQRFAERLSQPKAYRPFPEAAVVHSGHAQRVQIELERELNPMPRDRASGRRRTTSVSAMR